MDNPKDIIDALGVERCALACEVSESRVKRARIEATLPASWFFALSALHGSPLPEQAFSFKGAVDADPS